MANAGSPGNDLRATLALNPQEAYHGTERTLTLPGGRQVTLPIPPRAVSGQEIRLVGQGDPSPNGKSGDLIITLAITTEQIAGKAAEGEDPNAATIISSNFNNSLPMTQRAVPTNPPPHSQPGLYTASTPDYQSPSPPQTPSFQIPYYQSAPQPSPPRKKRGGLIVLVAVAVLVLIGGFLLTYVTVISPQLTTTDPTAIAQKTQQAQITATTQIKATSTASAQATSTAINNTTATATATEMDEYRKITSGKPVINDSMQQQSANNWYVGTNCMFKNKAYHVIATTKNYFYYCISNSTKSSNFLFQFHTKIVKGDGAGVIFRVNDDYNQYYLFRFNTEGNFRLDFYDSTNDPSKDVLIEKGHSNLLQTGKGRENTIAILARDNTFKIYLNRKYAQSIVDQDRHLSSGNLGFVAVNLGNATEVAFTQVQVWKL